jgi:hypothetical protein
MALPYVPLYTPQNLKVCTPEFCFQGFYKPEDGGFETQWSEWIFSVYQILPASLGPGVRSASNRNEYQMQENVSEE